MSKKEKQYILYRIFYKDDKDKDYLVYVGRAKQPLTSRLHGHFFTAPMTRTLSIERVSKIEYSVCESEADMNIYEIYYINLLKPVLNVDDKCKDEMTVVLPELEWVKWDRQDLIDKWIEQLSPSTNVEKYRKKIVSEYCQYAQGRARRLVEAGKMTEEEWGSFIACGVNICRHSYPDIDCTDILELEELINDITKREALLYK